MASRILRSSIASTTLRSVPTVPRHHRRAFQTSARLLQDSVVATPKRPVGAFRGGLFGFLLGSTLAGAAMYYYVLDEYRVSNELLTEDIYNLQATVHRVESYIKVLEDRVQDLGKKGK